MRTLTIGSLVAERNSLAQRNLFVSKMAGQDVTFPVTIINGNEDGPILNLHAGIHGDEFEGINAIWKIIDSVKPDKLAGAIIATPIVHTAAYAAGTRESPIDGKNLARVFPGNASGTATDRLAKFFFDEVVMKSDYTLGLHSGGYKYKFHPLVEYYRGLKRDVEERALAAAEAFAIGPFDIIQRLPVPPVNVTCTSEASLNGVPGIEPEMWGEGRCLPQDVEDYVSSIMNVLRQLRMIDGEVVSNQSHDNRSVVDYVEGVWVLANSGGLFISKVRMRENVGKDQLLGEILDDSGHPIEEVTSPATGFVAVIRTFGTIRPGDWAFMIEKPIK